MSNLAFGLLVLGIPVVCIAVALLLGSSAAFFDRHPVASRVFDFSYAGYFAAIGLVGIFKQPPHMMMSMISLGLGILFGVRSYVRFRSRTRVSR